jgi:hypothetical protein
LRSFFVPKTSATISRTINQCQMLNEPMTENSPWLRRACRSRRRMWTLRPESEHRRPDD